MDAIFASKHTNKQDTLKVHQLKRLDRQLD
jgi:hypothetical protein